MWTYVGESCDERDGDVRAGRQFDSDMLLNITAKEFGEPSFEEHLQSRRSGGVCWYLSQTLSMSLVSCSSILRPIFVSFWLQLEYIRRSRVTSEKICLYLTSVFTTVPGISVVGCVASRSRSRPDRRQNIPTHGVLHPTNGPDSSLSTHITPNQTLSFITTKHTHHSYPQPCPPTKS